MNDFIKLLHYSSPKKGTIVFASFCSLLNKLCDIVPEILIGISIDIIVNQEHSLIAQLGIINPFYQLYAIGILTTLLWILESVFEYWYSLGWRTIAQQVQHSLRLKTYEHLQNLDLVYFENTTVGGLLNILYDDINQLEQFLAYCPNEVIQLMVNVLVMGTLFFYVSPLLATLTLFPIPFVIGIAYYFQHKLAFLYGIVRQTSSNLASHIAYRLQGITTIKSYTTESYELERLNQVSDIYKKSQLNAYRINAHYVPSVRMAIMVGFIMSLVVGGIYTLQGKIPLNWYAALVFLTQRFLWPFATIATITDTYEKTLASARRILKVLHTISSISDGTTHLSPTTVEGRITFENVSFVYNNGIKVFEHLHFEIPAKKTVAFVGATGSGKSTIVKLLLRFYDPNTGFIAIDNHPIKNISLKDLRATIGLVSQDAYLVEGTIAENIAYGTFEASEKDIIEAAQIAQAHQFIIELREKYNTRVQEHGKNLSGGQRQRIAIARALLKKAPILVFDEATSALDNETEATLHRSITKLKSNHTILIIAHRLSTVRNADIIFVLEKGTIAETGKHEELLKKNGIYAHLWNQQL